MRVPLLAGTRLLVVNAPDDAVVLSPPEPPPQAISDVGAAVRDALRFPLAGPQLAAVVGRDARATIVTDVPALPIPSAPVDARPRGDRRRRSGSPRARRRRRAADDPRHRRAREAAGPEGARPAVRAGLRPCVPRARAGARRREPGLVELGEASGTRCGRTRDRRGGRRRLRQRGGDRPPRRPGGVPRRGRAGCAAGGDAASLLEPRGALGWELALAVERAVAARTSLTGVSLALDLPRIADTAYGYPYDRMRESASRRSQMARLFRLVPGPVRLRVPPLLADVSDRRRGLRRPALGRARGGSRAGDRSPLGRPRRAARGAVPRHPADDAAPATGASEPDARRLPWPRARLPDVAVPPDGRRGWNGDPRPPLPPPVQPPDAAAVPRLLPCDPRGPRPGGDRGRGGMPPRPTTGPSRGTAADARAIPGCRSRTGRRSTRRQNGSAR